LFKLPEGLHEVNELSFWDEGRLRKALVGKPAPDLQVKDMKGTSISLASLKGKTVMLDFWATWCPPCQTDASSLEKLNQKYGNGNLAIVGISVGEERATVEKYLKKHRHSYPMALSIENEMPPVYQIGVLPTYFVIAPDGTLMSARQGDQGFANLRRDLEKAGLAIE
jgi:thiol-disulfide isomerase/thioredoxin